jgi:S-adenosylmethionine synthetase
VNTNTRDINDFYTFQCGDGKPDAMCFIVNGRKIDMIIDSGANCNLMSECVLYNSVCFGGEIVTKHNKKVYVYGSDKPMKTKGSCVLEVKVFETGS